MILKSLNLVDWLCARGDFHYIFNEDYGRKILKFMIDKIVKVLTYFKVEDGYNQEPMEELIFNKEHKGAAKNKKFDAFPFNKIGTVI